MNKERVSMVWMKMFIKQQVKNLDYDELTIIMNTIKKMLTDKKEYNEKP